MSKKQKKELTKIIISAVLFAAAIILKRNPVISSAFYLAAYICVGYRVLWKAVLGIIHGQVLDENFLMAVASLGAVGISVYDKSFDFTEAVAVMLLYQVGELFESIAVGKSRRSISGLMDIRPDCANIEKGGSLQQVDPSAVPVGNIIVVRPGEKVPIDGIVEEGSSDLNTSALTGESLPRFVSPGCEVISGSICMTGLLKIRTTKEFGESTVSKILELVENAGSRKAKSEEFISKFARIYTPAVCGSALALAVIPPLVRLIAGLGAGWSDWIYRALTFLVISCPCALVISVPLTFFAGIGGASRAGILIKGSNFMETLSKVKTVVFDKTGTLTKGMFEVTEIRAAVPDSRQDISTAAVSQAQPDVSLAQPDSASLLFYAAHAECASTHPISRCIRNEYEKSTGMAVDSARVSCIKEIPGQGVTAVVSAAAAADPAVVSAAAPAVAAVDPAVVSAAVAAGNSKLMHSLGIEIPSFGTSVSADAAAPEADSCSSGTLIHVAVDGKYFGCITVEDTEKATSKEAIAGLKQLGITKAVMLTGDSAQTAGQIAARLGIDEVHSNLLPSDKVGILEKIMEKNSKSEKTAFVGDGINDAPVLARADVGIAMGAMGSDAAIEAADIVLMDDDPLKISKAIKVSRKCIGIVYQNIIFALVIKFGCLILSAFGIANMWLAIFADVGVMILAVLNSIRALKQ